MTEAEYQYLKRRLLAELEQRRREEVRAFDAFCEWLNYVGFGWLVVGLRVGNTVWQSVRRLWRRIFS